MFKLTLEPGVRIDVLARNHQYHYATDGSLPNPLESTYAALAGCAGVYAKKACRELAIDDAGIAISLRIVGKPAQSLIPCRIETTVVFPHRFDEAQRTAVLQSIGKCAVKALIQVGPDIEFTVEGEVAP